MKGYQADVGVGWWGKLYEEHGRGLPLGQVWGAPSCKLGEWNTYEISCIGSKIRTTINGQPCVTLDDPQGARRGILAFQLHSGGPTEVRYKDLKVRVVIRGDDRSIRARSGCLTWVVRGKTAGVGLRSTGRGIPLPRVARRWLYRLIRPAGGRSGQSLRVIFGYHDDMVPVGGGAHSSAGHRPVLRVSFLDEVAWEPTLPRPGVFVVARGDDAPKNGHATITWSVSVRSSNPIDHQALATDNH